MEAIIDCLKKFCEASRQKISCGKSNIYFSKNVKEDLAWKIASLADIPITNNIGKYLGTPSIHGRAGLGLYQKLIDQVETRLED